jgi:PhnB protein
MNAREEVDNELGPLVVQLTVRDAAAAVDFYRRVFAADQLYRNTEEGGHRIVHCELLICGARIALHDEFPELNLFAPPPSGSGVSLNLYVDDAESLYARAIAEGAASVAPPALHFWGALSGSFRDPFGHRWIVSSQVEDPAPEEIVRRSKGAPIHARLSAATPPAHAPGDQTRG